MTKTRAELLGALAAVLLVGGWVLWKKLAPRPCTGAVFIDFAPPLPAPGPYRFRLRLDAAATRCEFEVPFPDPGAVSTASCQMRIELSTRGRGPDSSITGLAVGAHPKRLRLEVRRGSELVYDADLQPDYSAYPTTREESKRMCGSRASLVPDCIRNTSVCLPFRPACDGPEDCPPRKRCCASVDQGRRYGAPAAATCEFESRCAERFGLIACHASGDCPSDAPCRPAPFGADFAPALLTCEAQAPTGGGP